MKIPAVSIALLALVTSSLDAQESTRTPERTLAAPPDRLVIDGRVAEWTGSPTFLLDASSQVAGRSKVGGGADLSARVWVTIDRGSLVVAGDVVDDAVSWPTDDGQRLASDHVEVWLALPEAEIPPIGYGNQFLRAVLDGPDPCPGAVDQDGNTLDLELDGCRLWVERQRARRQLLHRLFVRQFNLAPIGVLEQWSQTAEALEAAEDLPLACCAKARVAFQRTPRGYAFEAAIPFEHWPASARSEVATLDLLVDLVDNDEGHERQESFLSSSPRRRFADVSTFNRVALAVPLRFESDPALVARTLSDKPHLFLFPTSSPVATIWGFQNIAYGYQYQPESPSPAIYSLDLPREPLATLADLEVWAAPSDLLDAAGLPVTRLITRRGGAFLQALETTRYCPGSAEASEGEGSGLRPGGDLLVRGAASGDACHLLVLACEGTLSPYGAGACGACPTLGVEVVAVDPRTAALRSLDTAFAGSMGGGYRFGLEATPRDPSGYRITGFEEMTETCSAAAFEWKTWVARCAATGPEGPEREAEYLSFDSEALPGSSPLFVAIFASEVDEVRRQLDRGEPVDATDTVGHSALWVAAARGEMDIVNLLLSHGAEVDFRSRACGLEKGMTPLLIAAENDHRDVVERLLTAGARGDLKLDDGRGAADLLINPEIKALLTGAH